MFDAFENYPLPPLSVVLAVVSRVDVIKSVVIVKLSLTKTVKHTFNDLDTTTHGKCSHSL